MDEDSLSDTNRVASGYDVLAQKADEDLARRASPWGNSQFQQHYSWPATRPVIPALADCTVLLAGCGRGDYVQWFRQRGATVTGVDISETAIEHARERFGDIATFHHADLTERLGFASDDAFDLIVSNLAFSHIEAWQPVLEEFHRISGSDGTLVVVTIHPEYIRSGAGIEDYYATEQVPNDWPGVEIPTYYRPMNGVVTPFIEAGYSLEVFDEPKPRDSYEDHYPKRYENALKRPELLVLRARVN